MTLWLLMCNVVQFGFDKQLRIHEIQPFRFLPACASIFTSICVLVVLMLLLAGPINLDSLFSGSVWHILIISVMAAW
jgi:hypothetical protein